MEKNRVLNHSITQSPSFDARETEALALRNTGYIVGQFR